MTKRALVTLVSLLPLTAVVHAELPEPEFVLYGEVTGAPPWLELDPTAGLSMEIRLQRSGELLDEVVVASDGSFSLRVPMDSVDPQRAGTSRAGLPLDLFLGGIQLDAANSSQPLSVPPTGERGTYRRLDINLDAITPGVGFTIVDASTAENAINGTVEIEILLQNDPGIEDQQVNWLTVGGTATPAAGDRCGPNDDFIPASGLAQFAPGQSSASVSVALCDNDSPENDEVFWVRLANPSSDITLARSEAQVTIRDDDGVPSISVGDIAVREPRFDQATANFRVVLDGQQASPVSFDYATLDGSATAGADYTPISGSATIAAGTTELLLSVNILADRESDDGEQFLIRLSNPSGALISDGEAVATIADADNDGSVIIDDGSNQTTISGPVDLAVHSQSNGLYVANRLGRSISRFDLDPDTGALSNEQSWTSTQLPGAELDGLTALAVAENARWLMVAAGEADAVSVLGINANGALSLQDIARNGAMDDQANAFEGLADINAIAISPDSAHLYAVSGFNDSLSVLSVAESGSLSMLEMEQNAIDDPLDTGVTVEGLVNPSDVLVSKDGRSVYAASPDTSSILHFSRDASAASTAYGELSFRASYASDALSEPGLEGVAGISMSDNGAFLYTVSPLTGEVSVFSVGINGELSFIASQVTSEPGTLADASDVLASSDGEALLASSSVPGSLHVFQRYDDGDVRPRQVLLTDRDAAPGLAGAQALAQEPQRPGVLYLAAYDDDRVSVFEVRFKSLLFRDRFEPK